MRVGVIGAGSWGTALAKAASEAGHQVTIWAYEADVADQINQQHLNQRYLSGIELPPSLVATNELAAVASGADMLLSVTPSHVVRAIWEELAPHIDGDPYIVSASKGIENVTLATMLEVLREVLPPRFDQRLSVLSGPSFAQEVAQRLPTAVVVASVELPTAQAVQQALSTDRLRLYTSTDTAGVEIGGAAKNVIAIAAGIADGLGFGTNTRAALITRGLAEITRLAVAKSANPLTLAGLAGLGDLVLTCTGVMSRNRSVGLKLGEGQTLEQIQGAMSSVAEGIRSAKSCRGLARRLGVEMPIIDAIYSVLYDGVDARDATQQLMQRQLRHELEH
ncbi:MAG: NAD(P)-dependent glycerol-3-phosphate dehydrogenase [Deltaproteobacteria bacterium]|nr:NAD(P)-dependent glycerol-3-phosphate dehydrogenase [Deltaproteobacteria bacterium]